MHLLCGDLNARHVAWDSKTNDRGAAICEISNSVPRTYICAADKNSYHKIVYKKHKGKGSDKKQTKVRTVYTSNPYIGISRSKATLVHVE